MKVLKRKDHYLLKNDKGEYHLSLEDYKKLGKAKAIEFAEQEIDKKLKSNRYTDIDIDFDRASELGFCTYGIEDFCKQLSLDITATYKISELASKLSKEVFLEYPSECMKLFGDSVFDIFGGAKQFLLDNPTEAARNAVLSSGLLTDKQKHLLGCKFAERVLHKYEEAYPDDNRPRNAIETKYEWIEEKFGA